MKDIFKLTFKDKRFKVKIFFYILLIAIVEMIAIAIPVALMDSGSDFGSVIGLILFFVVLFGVMVFSYKIIINKIIASYYPQINIDSKDVVMKILALVTIFYPLIIVAYVVIFIFAIMSAAMQSMVLAIILLILGVILTYQVAALLLSVIYIILDLIENNVLGYKCVFNQLSTKLSKVRKYSGQIIIRSVVYSILASLVATLIIIIVTTVLLAIGSSVGSYIFSLIIVYLLSVLLFGWIGLNTYHFMIIRYENIKKLLNS